MAPSGASIRLLVERAAHELFSSAGTDQRSVLAEAWAHLRRGAAALADLDHGRLPPPQAQEALEHAQAAIAALLRLQGQRARSGA